ncbi:hypothetical protein ACLOJK_025363 [Asimina triloba]
MVAWKDAVEEACENGVAVIAEPGGSIRDKDAIDCCNKYGVSLLFTKRKLQLFKFCDMGRGQQNSSDASSRGIEIGRLIRMKAPLSI